MCDGTRLGGATSGKRALPREATIAILGLDGAGKSTVFAALRGLFPDSLYLKHGTLPCAVLFFGSRVNARI